MKLNAVNVTNNYAICSQFIIFANYYSALRQQLIFIMNTHELTTYFIYKYTVN